MSGAVSEAEATRARPLSGGLWNLIAWLRRDDSGSGDSLSSAGSDRTVASFAFLSLERYRPRAAPARPPALAPPTDSYRRRVRDGNSRLQRDRNLTLHRKYGLPRGDGTDTLGAPFARRWSGENRDREERERRAGSSGPPRRAAHVPGKRRAPPPPGAPRAATLPARAPPRKRPAPQPPLACRPPAEAERARASLLRENKTMACEPEKCTGKEKKTAKPRPERSLLKQIFEGRKRNSAVDAVPGRILPSISELDRQATAIVESCKLRALARRDDGLDGSTRHPAPASGGDVWFCTRCLRKYDDSVVTCGRCVTEQRMKLNEIPGDGDRRSANRASGPYPQTEKKNVASTSRANGAEEKQKLKEMLKEIKDSLPKRPKRDVNDDKDLNNDTTTIRKPSILEAPTLRIGSTVSEGNKTAVLRIGSESLNIEDKTDRKDVKVVANSTSATETAVVMQPIVLQHLPSRDIVKLEHFKIADLKQEKNSINSPDGSNKNIDIIGQSLAKESSLSLSENKCNNKPSTTRNDPLNTPLKISSLLNSNLLPEKDLPRRTSFLQSDIPHQQKSGNQTPISFFETKPLVPVSNLSPETILNSPRNINIPAAPTGVTKIEPGTNLTPQGKTITQKPLKANTTTQTSPNNSKLMNVLETSKKNITGTKDAPSNEALDIQPKKIESGSERKNKTSSLTAVSEAQTSTISLTPNAPVDNIETKVENKANQNKSSPFVPLLICGQVSKLDVSRELDHHQRTPSTKIVSFDQHLRRRDLIKKLEQSIAKGDERAAADAAAKLAQLRLSCSVLSFSSQIVGASSPSSSSGQAEETSHTVSNKIDMDDIFTRSTKLEPKTGLSEQLQASYKDVGASTSKTLTTKQTVPTQSQSEDKEKKNQSERQALAEPSTSKQNVGAENENVSIEVWIEDREATRGPIRINMPRVSVMGDLRTQANAAFGLAAHLQRWIVGKTLCTDDNTPLRSLAGPEFDAPFYLCLVEPETNKHTASCLKASSASNNNTEDKVHNVNQTKEEDKTTDVYAELVLLERRALVPNAEEFECGVCIEHYKAGQGAVLRECVHTFCRECLADVVRHSEEPAVSCPAMGCPGFLQEREIRALVSPEDYERWLARGLAAAESGTRNAFHCRTPDCQGWALCEPGVTRFPCPVCKRTTCVSCQAIHEGDTCEQHRTKQRASEAANHAQEETDEGTRAFLDTLISRGEALECPECNAIITKKWGCDWIKCSACKTEICWVTRGRRWGPGGRGDTSAGCRCGVEGKRCHPSCGYCH